MNEWYRNLNLGAEIQELVDFIGQSKSEESFKQQGSIALMDEFTHLEQEYVPGVAEYGQKIGGYLCEYGSVLIPV